MGKPAFRPTRSSPSRSTRWPTFQPTRGPTIWPSEYSSRPTRWPTSRSTGRPTIRSTRWPTFQSTRRPTVRSTGGPLNNPPGPLGPPWGPPYPYYIVQQAAPVPTQTKGDSDAAKPDKFTGKDLRKLRSFISSCIMVFNNKPFKFKNDRQRVSYAASFLSEITLLWWQPNLMAFPEPTIWSDWSEFITELDKLFGEPDLVQASE